MKSVTPAAALVFLTASLYSSALLADGGVLNSRVSSQDLVSFCAGRVGTEAVPAQLDVNGSTLTGVINCEQEYVRAASAAVASGQGNLAATYEDEGDDDEDDDGDDSPDDDGDASDRVRGAESDDDGDDTSDDSHDESSDDHDDGSDDNDDSSDDDDDDDDDDSSDDD